MKNSSNGRELNKKSTSTCNKLLLIALAIVSIVLVLVLVLLFFVLIPFAMQSPVQIGPGEVGVVLDQGEVQDNVLYEGLHFTIPTKQKVVIVEVRVQKFQGKPVALSSDNIYIEYKVLLNYHIFPDKAHLAYKEQRIDSSNRTIASLVKDAIKTVTVQYKADELFADKTKIEDLVSKDLKPMLEEYHLSLDEFSIADMAPRDN